MIPKRIANLTRDSIQRRWWFEPILDATSANTTCNYDGGAEYADNALNASLHATIEAGQTITAWWDAVDFDPTWARSAEYVVGCMFLLLLVHTLVL